MSDDRVEEETLTKEADHLQPAKRVAYQGLPSYHVDGDDDNEIVHNMVDKLLNEVPQGALVQTLAVGAQSSEIVFIREEDT